MHKRSTVSYAVLPVAFCLLLPTVSLAQRVGFRAVGRYNYSPVSDFRQDSFGLGDLPGPQPASGGGVLGSSIYSGGAPRGSYVHSSAGGGGGQSTPALVDESMRQTRVYDPMAPLAVATPTTGPAILATRQNVAQASNQILAAAAELTRGDRPVSVTRPALTSLAPPEPGAYRAAMLKGENDLRQENYAEAITSFTAAKDTDPEAPEALLALAQAYLATADSSYGETAKYLGETLKAFPALLLVRVHPKDFYATPATYDRIVAALDQHVTTNPGDAAALFVQGYLLWRDGKLDDAFDVLSDAVVRSKSPELTQAIDLLLRGMGQVRQEIAEAGPKMQSPVEFPWAGISLALPEGFSLQPLSQINRAMVATGGTADAPQRISLSLYPIGKDIELPALMDSVTQHLDAQLGVTDSVVEADAEVPFLAGKAAVRAFGCTYGSKRVVGVRLCFIRDVPQPSGGSMPMAYVLGMGVMEDQADQLLPALASVARSIKLTDFRRPIDLPISKQGRVVSDPQLGFTIRQPADWVGSFSERGFTMGQFDCLRGGDVSPRVELIVATVPADFTAESFGKHAIEAKAAEGFKMEVLSHGPADLAGRKGYQFVVHKQTVNAEASEQPAESIEIGRLILTPGQDGQQRMYAIVVQCQDVTWQQADAVMAAVAPDFSLLSDNNAD